MYYSIYKCRLCGEQFISEGTSTKSLALEVTHHTSLDLKQSEPIHPEKTRVHFCEDGSYGMADFLGMKYKKEESEDT